MRPIRRFGTSGIITDRISIRNHDKLGSVLSRSHSPSWSSASEDKRKRNFYSDAEKEKENGLVENRKTISDSREIILSTPSFQLICDRRHIQAPPVNSELTAPLSADKQPKSVLKKSENGLVSTPATNRSRWPTFSRRAVSFADDKGLKLADIRIIDLNNADDHFDILSPLTQKQASGFIADFILPPSYRRLRALEQLSADSAVVLETYTASKWSATGVIAARSAGLGEKRVFVRYTLDQWLTSTDNDATKIPPEDSRNATKIGLGNVAIDRFSFLLPFPVRVQAGSKLEFKFGIRTLTETGGLLSSHTNWDDNNGSNYSFSFI